MSDLWDALARATRTPDEAEGRRYGLLVGRIVDVDDPANLGRVQARIGAQGANDRTGWIDPLWGGAIEETPAVGDFIYVQFVDGDPNRPTYCVYATSKSEGRPSEAVVLGSTFARLYNDQVERQNAIVAALWGAMTGLQAMYNAHKHLDPIGGVTEAPVAPWAVPTPGDAGKIKAADGSTPSALAGDTVALSGVAKVK